jgi:aryl-phospho-beta-D-glucosidase BglC (GH1 family)
MQFNFVDSMGFWQDHWSTYIVEDDFAFMAANGLNAVRIPVGWWIANDPNPPAPFVGGSLQALDNAFTWAEYVHTCV